MRRITLACTAHSEVGECNEDELLEILLAVAPEVIFEEIRPADFESSYADESRYSLEMRAIKAYLKTRTCRQVPVDDYEIPESFVPHMRALEEFVVSRSSAYRDALDEIRQKQFQLGFSYLNSAAFVSKVRESERLYRDAVAKYGNDLAKNKLAEWNDQLRKRDASMLGNIYSYCQRTEFTEGIFLVGAGHMPSIMDGIQRRMKNQPTAVSWRFWNAP